MDIRLSCGSPDVAADMAGHCRAHLSLRRWSKPAQQLPAATTTTGGAGIDGGFVSDQMTASLHSRDERKEVASAEAARRFA